MSASTILGDVTNTLKYLLDNRQNPGGIFTVSLRLPSADAQDLNLDGDPDPNLGPKINLYMFLLEENQTAKNRDWTALGVGALEKPPLTLNLYYVLTPLAENFLDEHRALGEAMRILYDHSIIPTEDFQGDQAQLIDELKIDLCPFTIEELTRIWSAFNQPYRLSVCYRVRIVTIDSAIERKVTRVLSKEEDYALDRP